MIQHMITIIQFVFYLFIRIVSENS